MNTTFTNHQSHPNPARTIPRRLQKHTRDRRFISTPAFQPSISSLDSYPPPSPPSFSRQNTVRATHSPNKGATHGTFIKQHRPPTKWNCTFTLFVHSSRLRFTTISPSR